MSKDPAFLFYPADWLGGTMGMTFEEKGAYMELLMLQFNRGHMTSHMIGQILGQSGAHLWDGIRSKFETDENGMFYNDRLEIEKARRKKYTDSRNNNRSGSNQHTKSSKKDTQKSGHMTSHMVNEDVNVNEDINTDENPNLIPAGKSKIDYEAIVQIFNSVCINLPKVSKLSEKRKSLLKNRISESSLEALGDVFRKVSESRFLNGENKNGWKADFDWILNPSNYLKISEDNYKNPNHGGQQKSTAEQFSNAINSDAAKNFRFGS